MRKAGLQEQHTPAAIQGRLNGSKKRSYLGDAVLGAIDGTVTTFAVVSGVAGAGMRSETAVILGLANLLADGFSMAVGNFLRAKSEREIVEKVRQSEEKHVELIPEGEREEIRQIFLKKGFSGQTLEEIISVITKDREQWVDTMLVEEFGLQLESPKPVVAAFSTFASFCLVGLIPLLPFLLFREQSLNVFPLSSFLTAGSFFMVGILKGSALQQNKVRTGIETLLMGCGAATLAYLIGLFGRYIF